MGIGPAVFQDKRQYLIDSENQHGSWPNNEFWAQHGSTRTPRRYYYPRLNQYYIGSTQSGGRAMMRIDPLCVITTSPTTDYFTPSGSGLEMIVGDWDPVANVQKVYTTSGLDLVELDFSSQAPTSTWLFGSIAQGYTDTPGWGSTTTDGRKISVLGSTLMFEGWGYMVQTKAQIVEGTTAISNVMSKTDLTTGESTIMSQHDEADGGNGFVNAYTGDNPLFNPYILGEKNGHSFRLTSLQFLPDISDANYNVSNPKGRLITSSMDGSGEASPANNMVVNKFCRIYTKIVEFNPNNVDAPPGGVTRIHGREILFSRWEVRQDDTSDGNDASPNSLGANPSRYFREAPFLHPQTETFYQHFNEPGDDPPLIRFMVIPSIVSVDQISAPNPLGTVATNTTVTFQSACSGDLGEAVSGIDLAWTLERLSSVNENLDTVGTPSESTVDNPVIDAGTLVVERLGVVLVEGGGNDYTVDESTGIISWLGSHPDLSAGYTATYAHANTPVTPAHGTLLTNLSTTDSFGLASALVQYADNDDLVGQRDRLTVVEV